MLTFRKNGQTSNIFRVKILSLASATGGGLTGLTNSTASLNISTIADNEATATAYTQAGGTIQTITTLGTYAAPSANNCRFKEVDATNHPGLYELQFLDARLAVSNAKSLLVSINGPSASNIQQTDFVIQLQSDDPWVAKPTNFNLLSIDANGKVLLTYPNSGFKKNAALANFAFTMRDSTGALKTGLQASLRTTGNSQRRIDSGSFADLANIATITEIANGWYTVDFAAGDLNGDVIAVRLSASGAVDTDFTITTTQ